MKSNIDLTQTLSSKLLELRRQGYCARRLINWLDAQLIDEELVAQYTLSERKQVKRKLMVFIGQLTIT